MHFCTECGNMYYIRLTETNDIVYYCRNCGHEDDTITIDNIVVSQTSLHSVGSNVNIVNKYTKLDPTLPESVQFNARIQSVLAIAITILPNMRTGRPSLEAKKTKKKNQDRRGKQMLTRFHAKSFI